MITKSKRERGRERGGRIGWKPRRSTCGLFRNNFLNARARADNRTARVIYGPEPAWVPTANDGIKGSLARQDAITALRSITVRRAQTDTAVATPFKV